MMKKARDRHRQTLIEHLANPENVWPSRTILATDVLGFKHVETMYRHFSVDDLADIDSEALDIRRKKYSGSLAKIDAALLKEAETGNHKAAKLAYQIFGGFAEKKEVSASVAIVETSIDDLSDEQLAEIVKNGSKKG